MPLKPPPITGRSLRGVKFQVNEAILQLSDYIEQIFGVDEKTFVSQNNIDMGGKIINNVASTNIPSAAARVDRVADNEADITRIDALIVAIDVAIAAIQSILATLVPSATVEDETTFGISPSAGTATAYSSGDHTHGSPTDPTFDSAREFVITPVGGYAIKLVAGENLAEGEVVYIAIAGGTDGRVWRNPVDGDMPIGVVYADALAGVSVYIVVAGKAYVLPESGVTAARGYIMYSSNAEVGRVGCLNVLPAVAAHNREVGHFLATGSGNGVKTLAILHFN